MTPPALQQDRPAVPDATAEFYQALNDPTRWLIKQGVPVFKPHERVDPATGKQIKVDLPKLYRIANNMQQLERGGVPVRMTLGHTEPGKPEHQQPPVAGYYRNPRVQPFGPKGEPAVVVDEWLDPAYADKRKNFPYRSAEYYDDAEQITGVALLTRDPFLDLGVVAYSRGERPTTCAIDTGLASYTSSSPLATMYAANPATGRPPVMYRLTLGELPMFPPQAPTAPQPQQLPYPQPQPQFAAVPPQYAAPAPGPYPTPYSAPVAYPPPLTLPPAVYQYPQPAPRRPAPTPYGYGPARYAGPEDMGGGGNPLQAVYDGLSQAMSALQSLMEASNPAPQSPFPGDAGGAGMTPAARYAQGHRRPGGDVDRRNFRGGVRDMNDAQRRGMREDGDRHRLVQPRNPDGERGYARYERGQEPIRTISGRPVGEQLAQDRLNYQLQAQNEAIRVLLYERDQADTEWCVAEIRRLAEAGYNVGEPELYELKGKPREQRAAYLDNIVTKYQKVPTDQPPPILGDPTPGQAADPNRPISKEEMDQALKHAAANPNNPNAFTDAVNYMRSGGQQAAPTAYHAAALDGLPPFRRSFPPPEAAGPMAGPHPMPASFVNPYPEAGDAF